jgi:hypothetical protein
LEINTLLLESEYIFCLLSFVVENLEEFRRNIDVHKYDKYDIHTPNDVTKYHEGVYYTDIKSFNNLQPTITRLNYDIKVFKLAVEDYLLIPTTL